MKVSTTLFLTGALLLALIIKTVVKSKLRKRRYRNESALRNCSPAPTLHSTNLLGTSVLKASIKATKEDRGPQFIVNTMNSIGNNIHTLRVPVFNYEMIVTRDPRNVQAVFATKHEDWDISPLRAQAFMPFLGEGIFTGRGERWRHSRMLVRPQFAHDQISNLGMIEGHVKIMLDCIKSQGAGGWTGKLDLQPLFFYFTIDVATEFLYGQSVHAQSAVAGKVKGGGIDGKRFSENFNEAKHLVDKRGALQKFHWLMPMKRMNKLCGEIHEVIDHLIDERLSVKVDEEEKGRKFVLLDELAKLSGDRLELRRETLHVMMAGRDPTGSLLGWVFYFLARHKRVFEKLRAVVLEDFGTSDPETITFAKLRQCSYLQWVMNEAMRITAVIPMNERTSLRDTVLPTGGGEDGTKPIFVLEGTQILIPQYALQHRPDIWGEDVEEFIPERWEDRKFGFEWIPFGGGPRKCLGRKSYAIRFLDSKLILPQNSLLWPRLVTQL